MTTLNSNEGGDGARWQRQEGKCANDHDPRAGQCSPGSFVQSTKQAWNTGVKGLSGQCAVQQTGCGIALTCQLRQSRLMRFLASRRAVAS